jgi:hypothetical protein
MQDVRDSLEYESHKRQIALMGEVKYMKHMLKNLVSALSPKRWMLRAEVELACMWDWLNVGHRMCYVVSPVSCVT